MISTDLQISDAQAFAEFVVEGSFQRPITLINGETVDQADQLFERLSRLVAETDPSVRCLYISNSIFSTVSHSGREGAFVPLGVSVWWQGELAGSIIGIHSDIQLRQVAMTASSRPPLKEIDQLLQNVGRMQHHFFHRAAMPQIQPWVSLYLVNRWDFDRIQGSGDGAVPELVEIVRPVWLQGQSAGALFIVRTPGRPGELILEFASFNGSGNWGWLLTTSITRETQVGRDTRVIDNPQVAREDREFIKYTMRGSNGDCEFSIYRLSNDAEVLERALQGLSTSADSTSAPLGDRATVLKEALEELDGLVGLESLKSDLRAYANFIEVMQQRRQAGAKASDITRHFVFKGSPGTGKTTVARIIGRILYGYGLLEKGHLIEVDRSGLVAGFVGQTAIKTTEAFNTALDGVFFIDEAYALADADSGGQDYGSEAIATLMTLMENNRSRVSVIVAGYPEKIEQFLRSNPGLRSRFSKVFHFDDYSPSELAEVFTRLAKADGYEIEPEVIEVITRHFIAAKTQEGFGNARAARQLLEDSKLRHANRVAALDSPTTQELNMMKSEDIPSESKNSEDLEINEEGLVNVLGEIDSLIGLDQVKAQIRSLVDLCRVQIRRQKQGHPVQPQALNFVFLGNPGTGKTTVARLLGRVFAHLGLLSRGQLIEVSRSHLVAGYVGQTALKTRGQIDRALDGVLFVDEAYSLARGDDGDSTNDFGSEAIEQILLALENERHRMSMIFAGYTGPMNRFLSSNPGLRSRISNVIDFPDYTNEELALVFERFADENGYELSESARLLLVGYFKTLTRDQTFGNARQARVFFESVQRTHASRIAHIQDPTDEQLTNFLDDDILLAVGRAMGDRAPRIVNADGYL